MSWVKLDDQFFAHPKIIDLSKDAKLLHLAALTYCASQLTDGHIPAGALRFIASMVDVDRATAEELVEAGVWLRVEDSRFEIHDYLDYNPSAEQVKRERAANAKRQEDWRERKRTHNTVSNGNSNGVSVPPVTGAPSPSPSISRTPSPSVSGGVDSTERENRVREASEPPAAAAATPPAPSLSPSVKTNPPQTQSRQPQNGTHAAATEANTPPDAREPPPRADSALWAALLDGMGHSPVTRAERIGWGNWLAQLQEARASPDDIRRRCLQYRQRYGPDIPLTPKALVKHWSDFDGRFTTSSTAGQLAGTSVQALQQLDVDARRAEDNRLAEEKRRLAQELADELARSRQAAHPQQQQHQSNRSATHDAGRRSIAG